MKCPECGSNGSVSESPINDSYECSGCMIAFNSDGEVTARD